MRLTRHTDYALRILLQAAAAPDQLMTIDRAARAHGISRNHAMKVVNVLARAGLLATLRGRKGGFTLGMPASEIRIGDVVRLTEADLRPAGCGDCVMRGFCGLTAILDQAVLAFLASLDRVTLEDAVRTSILPLPLLPALRSETPIPRP